MSKKDKEDGDGQGRITSAEAAEVIMEERRARVEQCRAELQQLLTKHNCGIQPVTIMRGNQVTQTIEIVPME